MTPIAATPRRAERRRLAIEFVFLAGSTALFQATRLGAGILAAAVVPPARYAEWGLALAILAYSVYANGGLASGLNRELPRLLGQGDSASATAFERAAFAGSLIAAVATVGIVAAVCWLTGLSIGMLMATAAAAGIQQLYLLSQAVLRSRLRFNRASVQQAVLAVVFPLIGLGLIGSLGVSALAIGQTAAFAIGAMFAGRWLWTSPRLDAERIRKLASIGLPIMGAGLAFAFLTTLDRWIVHVALGEVATGQYTIAALLSSSALLVSMVLAQQFYPRMAHALGRGADSGSLLRMAFAQSAIATCLIVPLSLALVTLGPLVINSHLTDYASGVPALQILAIGFIPMVAASGLTNYLVVMGRSRAYLAAIVGAVVVEVAVAGQMMSFGVAGVATAALGAYAYLMVAALLLAIRTRTRR